MPRIRSRVDVRSWRAFAVASAVALILAAVFAWLTVVVVGGGADGTDLSVERWVLLHRTGWATSVLRLLTNLGSSALLWAVFGLAAVPLLWRRRDWPSAVVVLASLGGVLVGKSIVKSLVDRPRPPSGTWLSNATGPGYPSGHAMQALAVFGALALVLSVARSRRLQAALWTGALLIALVVGWSRIYLGVHWLTDVLGGFAFAGAWLALLAAGLAAIRSRAERARTEPYRPDPGR